MLSNNNKKIKNEIKNINGKLQSNIYQINNRLDIFEEIMNHKKIII